MDGTVLLPDSVVDGVLLLGEEAGDMAGDFSAAAEDEGVGGGHYCFCYSYLLILQRGNC